MPATLERKLRRSADAAGLTGERRDAYVYGTLRDTGWKPAREMAEGGSIGPASAVAGGTLGVLPLAELEGKHRLPKGLLAAMIARESAGDPNARSPKGALGLMQLMPDTAKELGVDPNDPAQNVAGGAQYMRQLLDRYQGSLPHALAAYNWGMGNLDRQGFEGMPQETRDYLQAVAAKLGDATSQFDQAQAVTFGEQVPVDAAPDATLPSDLPGAIAAASASRRSLGPHGSGGGAMPGSPDVDAFMKYMGDMIGGPSRALANLPLHGGAPQGMARGGSVIGYDDSTDRAIIAPSRIASLLRRKI